MALPLQHAAGISELTPAVDPAETVRTPADPPVRIGGFRLLDKLGAGGMGQVWRARQESVGREVALKLLEPHLARDPGFADRFMREARAAARVNHPHVVACHDAGVDQGRYYLALELVPGGDLARLMRRRGGRLGIPEAVRLGIDCARGLEAIEAAGLIHRDIKPANIFLTADPSAGGTAKLGDLGLARPLVGEDRLTHTGAALGTPAYMSPEQARGERSLDIRSDVYALGATIYELVTGEPPYRGETAYAVVSQVLQGPAPDPRHINPEISVALAAVILRAMASVPDQRYQTPRLLREDLELVHAGQLPLAYRQRLGANLARGVLTPSGDTTRQAIRAGARSATPRPSRRPLADRPLAQSQPPHRHLGSRVLMVAGGLLLLVVAIGLATAVVITTWPRSASSQTARPPGGPSLVTGSGLVSLPPVPTATFGSNGSSHSATALPVVAVPAALIPRHDVQPCDLTPAAGSSAGSLAHAEAAPANSVILAMPGDACSPPPSRQGSGPAAPPSLPRPSPSPVDAGSGLAALPVPVAVPAAPVSPTTARTPLTAVAVATTLPSPSAMPMARPRRLPGTATAPSLAPGPSRGNAAGLPPPPGALDSLPPPATVSPP